MQIQQSNIAAVNRSKYIAYVVRSEDYWSFDIIVQLNRGKIVRISLI
jgi:hypothetical protein